MPFKAYVKKSFYENENDKESIELISRGEIVDIYTKDEAMIYSCKKNDKRFIEYINNKVEEYDDKNLKFIITDKRYGSYWITKIFDGQYEKITNKDVLKTLSGEYEYEQYYSEYEIYDIDIMKCLSLLSVVEGSAKTINFKLIEKDGTVIKNDYYLKDSFTYEKNKDELKGHIYGVHTTRGKEVIVDCNEHSANIILKAIHMKAFIIKYVGNEDLDGLFKDDIVFEGSVDEQDSIEKEIAVNDKKNFDMKHTIIGFVIIGVILIIMKLLF